MGGKERRTQNLVEFVFGPSWHFIFSHAQLNVHAAALWLVENSDHKVSRVESHVLTVHLIEYSRSFIVLLL